MLVSTQHTPKIKHPNMHGRTPLSHGRRIFVYGKRLGEGTLDELVDLFAGDNEHVVHVATDITCGLSNELAVPVLS